MPVTEMKRSGIEVHGEYHYYQQSKIEQSDRPLVFYIFVWRASGFFTASTPNDTFQKELEVKNGENKSNMFLWE